MSLSDDDPVDLAGPTSKEAMDLSGITEQIDRIYDKVYALLLESEDYLTSGPNSRPVKDITADQRMYMINQEMRITVRLGAALAWLLMVRAMEAGEIECEPDTLTAVDPFDVATPCMNTKHHDDASLPERLRELLKKSHRLYIDVLELDGSLRGEPSLVH